MSKGTARAGNVCMFFVGAARAGILIVSLAVGSACEWAVAVRLHVS
jgi:hypothetical protein